MNIIKTLKSTLLCGLLIIISFVVAKDIRLLCLYAAIVIGSYKQTLEGINDTIKNKRINVELLMILSALGAVLINEALEGATLVFIFSLSGELETLTSDRSQREIRKLLTNQPQRARIKDSQGEITMIALEEVEIGETVYVLKGEMIPLDGIIIQGSSDFDEASITGESMPVSKGLNDTVYAGTLNITAPISFKTTEKSDNVMIQKIVRMVEASEKNESKAAQKIQTIETYYSSAILVAVVVFYAVLTVGFGWSSHDAFYRSIILLVVASPCALIASVTPATLAAIASSARQGVLIKGGAYLDGLKDIKVIAMDKTGTLTVGKPQVITDYFTEDYRSIVGEIEKNSTHPLAKAISEHYVGDETIEIKEVKDLNGIGLKAIVNGNEITVGKYNGVIESEPLRNALKNMLSSAMSVVYVTSNHELVGVIGLQDTIRQESKTFVERLKSLNIVPVIITGDHLSSAEYVGDTLGIKNIFANCLPDEKVNALKEIKANYDDVLMIGDGINDAPSLATASIGVSVGSGSDLAIESSDIVLMNSNLTNLAEVIQTSHQLSRITKQNIVFSLCVIAILIILNVTGILTLPLAVLGHEGSTILVIMNGLRMLKSN